MNPLSPPLPERQSVIEADLATKVSAIDEIFRRFKQYEQLSGATFPLAEPIARALGLTNEQIGTMSSPASAGPLGGSVLAEFLRPKRRFSGAERRARVLIHELREVLNRLEAEVDTPEHERLAVQIDRTFDSFRGGQCNTQLRNRIMWWVCSTANLDLLGVRSRVRPKDPKAAKIFDSVASELFTPSSFVMNGLRWLDQGVILDKKLLDDAVAAWNRSGRGRPRKRGAKVTRWAALKSLFDRADIGGVTTQSLADAWKDYSKGPGSRLERNDATDIGEYRANFAKMLGLWIYITCETFVDPGSFWPEP